MNNKELDFSWRPEKLHEECGVFGINSVDGHDCAKITYYALYALQHRGQQSSGIAVNDNGNVSYKKDMGLVPDVFNDAVLSSLKGSMAVGHVNYTRVKRGFKESAQPMVREYRKGTLTIANNGSLVNSKELRIALEDAGVVFHGTSDAEVIINIIARERISSNSVEEAINKMMKIIKGSYSMVVMTPGKLIGCRDPYGMRPLALGKLDNSYILSSESCAFDAIGAEFIRDLEPGEIVVIKGDKVTSIKDNITDNRNICIFEYIYFARPDSVIEGTSVYEARKNAGKVLAEEHPVEADLVFGVPDSGLCAAIGYSEASGIPYGYGLIKNRYIGRTFIQPSQTERQNLVKIKLNVLADAVKGKRVVMVDDSIVRGTTIRNIVRMLKEAGALEVHVRISSPPFMYPCYFGTDVPSRDNLAACQMTLEEIRQSIEADSLGYLSIEGIKKLLPGRTSGYCQGCFNGEYPMEVPGKTGKEDDERRIFTYER